MKNKILCCVLATIMLVSLFVVPVSAADTVIDVDALHPTRTSGVGSYSTDYNSYYIPQGNTDAVWLEYDIEVAEEGMYIPEIALGGSFNAYKISANGHSIGHNWWKQGEDGPANWTDWYSCRYELPLLKGTNTIRVEADGTAAHSLISGLKFTKAIDGISLVYGSRDIENVFGGNTSSSATLHYDPWIYQGVTPVADGANFVMTWEVAIPKDGLYTLYEVDCQLNNPTIKLDGVVINDTEVATDELYANLNGDRFWAVMNSKPLELEKGTYTLEYSVPLSGGNVRFAAIRFDEIKPLEVDGDFEIANVTDGGSYMVDVPADASYRVTYDGGSTYNLAVTVNGETVNRRTGGIEHNDSTSGAYHYSFHNEITLKKGVNTISVSSGSATKLTFEKLDDIQYTFSTLHYDGNTPIIIDSYNGDKQATSPWFHMGGISAVQGSTYAEPNAPWMTMAIDLPEAGYYYPEVARGGVSAMRMFIDGQSFDMHGGATNLGETFIGGCNSGATCTYHRSNDAVYLEAGRHEVKVLLIGGLYGSESTWSGMVGAVRFTKTAEQDVTITVEAEDSRVTASVQGIETPITFNGTYGAYGFEQSSSSENLAKISGGKVVYIQAPQAELPATMTMDVVVTKSGEYAVQVLKANTNTLSEGKISIGSLENYELSGDNVVETQTNYVTRAGQEFDVLTLTENVYLEKGTHTMTITVDGDDVRTSTPIAGLFIDAVKFIEGGEVPDPTPTATPTPTDAPIPDITPSDSVTGPASANGIFEKQNEVRYNIVYGNPASGNLNVAVTDYYGNATLTKTFTCTSGAMKEVISLGALDVGWYKITISKDGSTVYQGNFAVVPTKVNRYQGESPFASDLAVNNVARDLGANYSNAASLAGMDWVRERVIWAESNDVPSFSGYEDNISAESAFGLDVIATYAEYPRGRYLSRQEMFTDELLEVYDFQKYAATYFGNKVDVWEIWNEMDHNNFADVPADIYSAFFKAAAIGVKDAANGSRVTFGGLCQFVGSNNFAELMIKNDVMKYSDIYNIHRHMPAQSTATQKFDTEFVADHIALMRESGYERPVWMTEAGLIITSDNLANNYTKQARYAITSTVESIGAGVDKHFWFLIPQYLEWGTNEYGVFDVNGQPLPAYVALSVMTDILGAGEYKGKYNSSSFEGHVFNNGTNDVLVIWSNTNGSVTLPPCTMYDMMYNNIGTTTQTKSVSYVADPRYYVFDGELSTSYYTPVSEVQETAPVLTKNDKIVVQSIFEGEDLLIARDFGYVFEGNETKTVKVRVHNFNDTQVQGTLNCTADGFAVTGNGQALIIPANGYQEATITITPSTVARNTTQYVSFYMTTVEGTTSPTVAQVVAADEENSSSIEVSEVVDGATYESVDYAIYKFGFNPESVIVRLNGEQIVAKTAKTKVSSSKTYYTTRATIEGEVEGKNTLVMLAQYNGKLYKKTIDFYISAPDVTFEGELIYDVPQTSSIGTLASMSGGRYLRYASNTDNTFEVEFYAPKAGAYRMNMVASQFDAASANDYISDYTFAINGKNAELIQSGTVGFCYEYQNYVVLNEGKNTLTFTMTDEVSNASVGGKYSIVLDKVSFTKAFDRYIEVYAHDNVAVGTNTNLDKANINFIAARYQEKNGTAHSVEYKVYAPQAGQYTFDIEVGNLSDYRMSTVTLVVGGTEYKLTTSTATKGDMTYEDEVRMYAYTLNSKVTLAEGYNTVIIKRNTLPSSTSTGGLFAVKRFRFTFDSVSASGQSASGATLSLEASTIKQGDVISATVTKNGSRLSYELFDDIAFATSNAGVATVDRNGNVRGITPGTATITATYVVGGTAYTSSAAVMVEADDTYGFILDSVTKSDRTAAIRYTTTYDATDKTFLIFGTDFGTGETSVNNIKVIETPVYVPYLYKTEEITVESITGSAKVFIWNNFENLKALTDGITLQ